ncbi:MAG: hypothetical protein KGJ84_12105 [Elusimicrobia bacterium]|nr:hypothetical protein [Elusimicrobiota bacterium]
MRKIADRRKAELADGSPFARINQEDNHLMLRPGESVATTPSALEPHFPDRLPGWDHPEDESTPEGRALSAKLKRDATRFYAGILDKKRLPPPPPAVSGFTSFAEGASLFRPGKYKIRAVFNGQIEAVSIYPYADRLPAIVRKYLRFFGSSIGVDLVPDVKAHSIRVAAESREVVLEIGR